MTEFIQIFIGGLLQGSVYAVLAVGFSLVFRVAGVVNLAQGAFCVLGALVMYSLQQHLGLGTLPAAIAAVVLVTMVAAALGFVAFLPGLARLSASNMLMLTVGILSLVEGAVILIWGSQPYTLPPFSGEQPLHIATLLIPSQTLWIFGVCGAVVLALHLVLTTTPLGRAARACAENTVAAWLMGIDVRLMVLGSFTVAAMIAAISGIVIAPITSLQFDTGRAFTIWGFIAVAIGGIGSFSGAIAGGLLLGIVSQLAAAYVSSLFSNALALGLLLLVLLVRPAGLLAARVVRRQDVREEQRVHKQLIRLPAAAAWGWGGAFLAAMLVLPWLLPEGGLMNSLVITMILFIAVLGLDVLMGWTGQINLGQAAFMAIGGYTAAFLAVQYDIAPLLGTLAGIVVSLVCAMALSLVTMRLRGLYLALATLAFGLLVDGLAVGLDGITGGPSGLVGIPSFAIGSYSFDTPISMYYLVLGLATFLLVLLGGGMRAGFGRGLMAVRSDQMAAAALGMNPLRIKLAAFAISAALASLSGSLYAFYFHFLSPDMVGTPTSLQMLSMLIIGGEGTLLGPFFGTALLTLLPTVFQPLAQAKTLASGALLILFFLYLPNGIFGAIARLLLALGRLRRRPASRAKLARSGL